MFRLLPFYLLTQTYHICDEGVLLLVSDSGWGITTFIWPLISMSNWFLGAFSCPRCNLFFIFWLPADSVWYVITTFMWPLISSSNNWFLGAFSYQEFNFFIFRYRFMVFYLFLLLISLTVAEDKNSILTRKRCCHLSDPVLSVRPGSKCPNTRRVIYIYQKIKKLHHWYENISEKSVNWH
jgi:hypothetical protein